MGVDLGRGEAFDPTLDEIVSAYVDGELQMSADIALLPQGEGRTSVGVRINLIDYFKGAVRLARFTRHALTPEEFLPPL